MNYRTGLFLNPSSGAGKAIKRKKLIEKYFNELGIKYKIFISRSENHLKELVNNNINKFDNIIGAGGDTTLNIIINCMMKKKRFGNLGMISLGSSNDIAREFGVYNIKDACNAVSKCKLKEVDLIELKYSNKKMFFLGTLSMGLGVHVNRYVEDIKNRSWFYIPSMQFITGTIGIMKSFKNGKVPEKILISTGNSYKSYNYSLIVFTNTSYYSSGFIPSPLNDPSDGILDCCISKTSNFKDFFNFFIKSLRKDYKNRKNTEILKSKRFKIKSELNTCIQVDGEIIGPLKEFELIVKKRAIKIISGAN